MEVRTSSQQYTSRWVANSDSPHPDSWRGNDERQSRYDRGHVVSSSPPIIASDGSVDKVLYQNLVEMIPLVETFIDQQNSRSFPRHASLVYTPSPSHDGSLLRKMADSSLRGKKGSRQLVYGKKGDLKEGICWKNLESNMHQDVYDEILSFSAELQGGSTASKAKLSHLQSQIEQLEHKLVEKDSQLHGENSYQQKELVRMQASIDELQRQILRKEREIQKTHSELSEKQHEVAGLHSLLEKAEMAAEESTVKVVEVQEELNNLQQRVASLLFQLQSMSSSFDEDPLEAVESLSADLLEIRGLSGIKSSHCHKLETEEVELARRKYLAALIAAKRYPTEELLTLVAGLRGHLQAYVLQFRHT